MPEGAVVPFAQVQEKPALLINKSIINLALIAVLAVSFGASTSDSKAQGRSDVIPSANDDNEIGGKEIREPTEAAKTAPSVSWLPPDGKPRLAMLCIHGFSLHKGCYAAFGKEMAKDGIATYAIDLRGFGESKENAQRTQLDFDGCLVDIKAELEQIHKNHPDLPVIILGESMGGAIALRATALYPKLVSGLVSSVPARDRFAVTGSEAKVGFKAGLSTIFGGYRKPMDNAAMSAVDKISDKEELRDQWKSDPLMRTNFSPKEFVQFDRFMADNLAAAGLVKDTPVLFIQGTNDKLIRPAGTWKLFERLSTANRQMVLSKNSEHLIFEEGQFRPDDLDFLTTWIDKNITPLDAKVTSSAAKLPVVASKEEYSNTDIASANNSSESSAKSETKTGAETPTEVAAALPPQVPAAEFKHRIATQSSPQINFWVELNRDGKTFRCNNKMEFKSGDKIRFHLIPGSDGYAYLVMKAGTTGKSDVLFPKKEYGTHNYLTKGQDYSIPATGWMEFDQHPGTEELGLVFSNEKVAVTPQSLQDHTLTCFVSREESGAKDLCPTRMKLSWDDPTPVMLPDDFSAISQVENAGDSSLVHLMSTGPGGMVSANIELLHGR
jgi:alpha-beta hydrolase superfamily lysophospholipase